MGRSLECENVPIGEDRKWKTPLEYEDVDCSQDLHRKRKEKRRKSS